MKESLLNPVILKIVDYFSQNYLKNLSIIWNVVIKRIFLSFFLRRLMFSQQAAHLFMQQPKKDDLDDRGSNPGGFSPSLFSLPPHSSHLFSSHHLANVVTSQQQADFLSAISSGENISKESLLSLFIMFKQLQNVPWV